MRCKHSEAFQANVPSIHLSLVHSHGLKTPAPASSAPAAIPKSFLESLVTFFFLHRANLWVYRMITGGYDSGPMRHPAPAPPREPGLEVRGSSAGPFSQPSLGKGLAGDVWGGKQQGQLMLPSLKLVWEVLSKQPPSAMLLMGEAALAMGCSWPLAIRTAFAGGWDALFVPGKQGFLPPGWQSSLTPSWWQHPVRCLIQCRYSVAENWEWGPLAHPTTEISSSSISCNSCCYSSLH